MNGVWDEGESIEMPLIRNRGYEECSAPTLALRRAPVPTGEPTQWYWTFFGEGTTHVRAPKDDGLPHDATEEQTRDAAIAWVQRELMRSFGSFVRVEPPVCFETSETWEKGTRADFRSLRWVKRLPGRSVASALWVCAVLTGARGCWSYELQYVNLQRELVRLPYDEENGAVFKTQREARAGCIAALRVLCSKGLLTEWT